MSSEEILEKVKGIIVEQLGVADTAVTMEASYWWFRSWFFRHSWISNGYRRRIWYRNSWYWRRKSCNSWGCSWLHKRKCLINIKRN
mgnify:CR=1 FL=1